MKKLPLNVVLLGLVSFFNDLASEMVYPLLPIFLTAVLHTAIPLVGFIEGFVEAVASISKYWFGAYSDYLQQRKKFVVGGYTLSAISKILIGLAFGWQLVLIARFIDRLGKGLRTAPRDSLLLENATKENKGYIFGFHRAFDSLGAVMGPLIALLLLYVMRDNIRQTFFIAFIPGCIAILLLAVFVHEKHKPDSNAQKQSVKIDWRTLSPHLKIFLVISFVFAAGNSSDAFLLLNAKQLGLATTSVVLLYVLYNISQTVFATPLGRLSDRAGAKYVFTGGLLVFAVVYFCFGFFQHSLYLWILFPLYGIYIAATDGVSKAYVSEFISTRESGTYFGAYYALTAVGTFLASLIGGLLWRYISPSATFYYGSAMAFTAFCLVILQSKQLRA